MRNLRVPVVVAPMFLLSGPALVIAACNSGVVGAFPTANARTVADLDDCMRTIVDAQGPNSAPWAANLVTHSTNQRLRQDLDLVERYRPPIVITALGSPKPAIDVVHSYGGLVIADVVSIKLAEKAVSAGADGLACICTGAGGHTGYLSPFAFLAAVRSMTDKLVILGGGIADGYGVAGAVAAGADLVYMGTRFIATHESLAVDEYKRMVVAAGIDDITVSSAITGTAASWLKPSLLRFGYDPDHMPSNPPRDYDSSQAEAKRWKDLWAAGQGVGAVRRIEQVSQVVEQLAREYESAIERIAGLGKV